AGLARLDAGDEEVVGRVSERAELLHSRHPVPSAVRRMKHGVEHELVAEALLGLAGDGGDAGPAADDLAEVAPLLLLGAERGHEGGHRRVHVEGERGGRAALGDLAQGVHVGDRIGADPAVLAGDGEREEAGRVQIRVVLVGERGVGVVPARSRREALAREGGHPLDHRTLLIRQGRKREHPASVAPLPAPAQCARPNGVAGRPCGTVTTVWPHENARLPRSRPPGRTSSSWGWPPPALPSRPTSPGSSGWAATPPSASPAAAATWCREAATVRCWG